MAEADQTVTENWTPQAADDVPSHFPDDVAADDGPFAWRNDHNGEVVYIDYDDSEDSWRFGGSGSAVCIEETLEEAQKKGRQYLAETTEPSAMVVG